MRTAQYNRLTRFLPHYPKPLQRGFRSAKHRIRQPLVNVPLERCIDAAASSEAKIGQVFQLLAQIKLPGSSTPTPIDFPTEDRPASIKVDVKPLGLEFPVDPASGLLGSTYVELRVTAPDCDLIGDQRHRVEVPANHDSAPIFVPLRPRRAGPCHITVEVYHADQITLGAIPALVANSGEAVEQRLQTTSLTILVHRTFIDARKSVGLLYQPSGDVAQVFGEQRNINTAGGVYAEGNIDQRSGSFVSGHNISIGDISGATGIAVGPDALAINIGQGGNSADAGERRNRDLMLNRVYAFWVEGVLDKSTHVAPMIPLVASYQVRVADDAMGRTNNHIWRGSSGQQCQSVETIAQMCLQRGSGLLILGAPGAGKTTMLLNLTRSLLEHAICAPAEPIPVIFNLSSWARERLSLQDWLIQELTKRYDVLRRQGTAWIVHDQILPLLDGLDEVPAPQRVACIEAINRFRGEHGLGALVVCCRIAEYEALIAHHHIRLQLDGALLVRPLTADQIDTFLANSGPQLAALREDLQQDHELRELAETPLMLSLMAQVYQGQIVENLRALPSLEERRQLLFAAYVEQMFERPGVDPRYLPTQTRRWLSKLAGEMQQHALTIFHLERLQPDVLDSPALRRRYTLLDRLGTGLLIGVPFGFFAGLVCRWSFPQIFPSDLAKAQAGGPVNLLVFLATFLLIASLFGGKSEQPSQAPQGLWLL
jgi:hypothetical protein